MEGNDMDMGIDGELEGQIEGGNHESSNVNSEGEQIQRIDSMASEDKLLSSYPYNNDSRNSSHEEPSVVHSQPKENDFNGSEGLKRKEKIAGGAEPSLRNVLSDPLTGLLMDDAMVAQCGHSFGLRSLQHVLETNLCMICGAHVPPESLIPNYALRAAVGAYEREDCQSHKILQGDKIMEQEQAEGSGHKFASKALLAQVNCSDDSADNGCELMGVQYRFSVNDRVIIKENKHLLEHSVHQEAVITANCLNGWYMVRTLDSGECFRLQYHSLQKVGVNETPVDLESGSYLGQLRDATQKIDLVDAVKDIPDKSGQAFSSSNPQQPENAGNGSGHCGQTSSNSSHELNIDQDEAELMGKIACGDEHEHSGGYKGADMSGDIHLNSQHGTGGGVYLGTDGFSPEGDCGHSGAEIDRGETKQLKKGRGGDALQAGGITGAQTGLDAFTVRSKRSSLIPRTSHMTGTAGLSSSGPYRKVYISGARKRTCPGNGSTFVPMIDKKSRGGSSPKSREIVEGDDVKHDGSNPGNIQMELLHIIKKGMANLEKDIPWICFQRTWRRHRSIWRKGLRESSTLQELSIKLQELRSSLLLSFAGGMPDEEWEKQLNTARDSGNTDLLIILWRNFNDDVSKWMTAKAKRSQVHLNNRIEADEYADLQKLFPSLIIEGFSPAGVTAATAIAAAEAFAHDGPKNTDVLLKVPMKLIRQHNHHDLIILREALEREKRHISAKLAVLDSKERNLNDFGESEGSDQSMDKKPLVKFLKHDPHLMLSSISTPQGLEQGVDPMKSKSNKNMESG